MHGPCVLPVLRHTSSLAGVVRATLLQAVLALSRQAAQALVAGASNTHLPRYMRHFSGCTAGSAERTASSRSGSCVQAWCALTGDMPVMTGVTSWLAWCQLLCLALATCTAFD